MIINPQNIDKIQLPIGWKLELLGNHSKIITSFKTFAKINAEFKENKTGLTIHYLKVSDMNLVENKIYFFNSCNTFYGGEKQKLEKGFLKPNSLVFPKRGAAIATNKKRITSSYSVLDPNLIGIEPNGEIEINFLYFFFELFDLKWLQDNNVIPQLNKHNVAGVKIPLPPLLEQRKIAYLLNSIQKSIQQQDKLIQTTTELKKALMQKLFTEGTKGERQKQTEIGLIPESWEDKPLIEAVEYIDYGISQAIPKTPPRNGVKIVSTADINRAGDLLYEQIRTIEVPQRTADKLRLMEGDLLFNWRNSAELIGKSTVFHEQEEPHIFASFILRIKCGEKRSHNYFMKYLMNHYREEGVFIKLARRAVNQANYNRNEISILKIPVPPIDEQIEIAKFISQVEGKINHYKSKKRLLTELFKTMLNDLMTGQRRVNEIDFESSATTYQIELKPLSTAAEK